jgi:O-antigen/teichoic acid export membrane protein
MILAIVSPIAYGRAGGDVSRDAAKKISRLLMQISFVTIGLTFIAAAVAAMFHSSIFAWLVGNEYRSASYLLPWVVIAGGIFSAAQVLSLQNFVQLNPKSLLLPKIATATLAVGVNLAGSYYFGAAGVVAAVLSFSVTYLLWICVLFNRELRAIT